MRSGHFVLAIVALIFFWLHTYRALCQELEPRAYTNIPLRMNFLVAGYGYTSGGVVFDPAIPLENAHITIHGAALGFARSMKIAGMSGRFDAVIPTGSLSGTAEYEGQLLSRDITGFADPRVRLSVNLLGAPALNLSEFTDYKQNTIVGASLQVSIPIGQYDPTKLVNIGTNRFAIKPELGISKKLGLLYLELAGAVSFYTENNNFFNGQTRTQKPIGSIQGHVIYGLKNGIWFAADGTYYWGGRTSVEGVEGNDLQENTRLGITAAAPITRRHSLKLHYSSGVSTRTGNDFNVISVFWQYRWAKGFPKK